MPKIIRRNVFETNSSSVHSMSITKDMGENDFLDYETSKKEFKKLIEKHSDGKWYEYCGNVLIINSVDFNGSTVSDLESKISFIAHHFLNGEYCKNRDEERLKIFANFIQELRQIEKFDWLIIEGKWSDEDFEINLDECLNEKGELIFNNEKMPSGNSFIDNMEGSCVFEKNIEKKYGVPDHFVGLSFVLNNTVSSFVERYNVVKSENITIFDGEYDLIDEAKKYKEKLEKERVNLLTDKFSSKIDASLNEQVEVKRKRGRPKKVINEA